MAKKSERRVRYRTGDVFQIPLSDGSFGYGRLLLDIKRLAKAGVFIRPSSLAGMCGNTLMVQVYRIQYQEPLSSVVDLKGAPVFLSEFVVNDQIYRAEFPIVGHLPVAPEELDFPEYTGTFVSSPEWQFHFEKGGVLAQARVEWDELDEWGELPKPIFSLGLCPEQILQDVSDPDGMRRRARDLRMDSRRDGVLSRTGLSSGMSYDEMCEAVGGVKIAELLAR